MTAAATVNTPTLLEEPFEGLLDNRRWLESNLPFRHLRGTDIFKASVYRSLQESFQGILNRGLAEEPQAGKFSRLFKGYDAYGYPLLPGEESSLGLFLLPAWHRALAAHFGVEITGDVSCELHHHASGSANGQVHNDLNLGYFVGATNPEGVNCSDGAVCRYKTGWTATGETPRKTARAIATIFYLANQPWRSGHGGETALYGASTTDLQRTSAVVPPINNSAICFECTPLSFHTFLSNVAGPRNAIVFWSHQSFESASRKWGDAQIGTWARGVK